jgi:hypothetical protein
MSSIINKFFENNLYKKVFWWAILFFIFIVIYYFNKITPYVADDFFGQASGKSFNSLNDIIISTKNSYFSWSGRFVAYFLTNLFFWLGKPIFNIFNTLAYLILALLIYINAVGKKLCSPSLLWIIFSCLFLFVPAWGQNFLWMGDAANYCWSSVFILLFLLPFRLQRYQNQAIISSKTLIIFYGLLGIIAGWTNENMSLGALSIVILFLLFRWREGKKIYLYMKVGTISCVLGIIFLLVAPGNFHRYAVESSLNQGYGINVISNFANITKMFWKFDFLFFPCLLLAFLSVFYKKTDFKVWLIYFFGSLVTLYVMVVSPYFADRTKLGVIVFLLTAIANIYIDLDFKQLKVRKAIVVVMVGMTVGMFSMYNIAYKDIRNFNYETEKRIIFLEHSKIEGIKVVKMPKIKSETRYTAASGNEEWNDKGILDYYGLKNDIAKAK